GRRGRRRVPADPKRTGAPLRPDDVRRDRARRGHLPDRGPLTVTHFPLLTVTLLLPLAGALVVGVIPKESTRLIRAVALLSTLVTFVVSLFIVFQFKASVAGPQLEDQARWVPQFGATLLLGVDGISLWLVILT